MNSLNNVTVEEPRLKTRLLHEAVKSGNIISLKYLLKSRGEDVNILEEQRQTALMIATYTMYKSKRLQRNVLKLILENDPKLNVKDNEGRTAFIHACSSNNTYVVKTLLSEHLSDLNLDAQDNNGMSGLMYAVQNNNLRMTSSILLPWKRFCLSLCLTNKSGENVMDIALKGNNADIINLLKEYGFYPNLTITNQKVKTASCDQSSRENKSTNKARGNIRRAKSSMASFNRKKKNKISIQMAPHSDDNTQNKPMGDLHKLFDIYTEQLCSSYKESAKTPVCLTDQDDNASIDSFGSIQSFRSVSAAFDRFSTYNADVLDSTHISGSPRSTRTRRTGANNLLVPNTSGGARLRKISAPCFPSNPMHFNMKRPKRPQLF